MGGVKGGVTQSWCVGLGLMLCFCFLINQIDVVESTTYNVGDKLGWGFNVSAWPSGKSFKAGDELVFRYLPGFHDVMVVDADGYNKCRTTPGSKVYFSGNDTITLLEGDNFFICSFPDHCTIMNMKIAVHAA
uniref:Plantacyanin n=1 Tax=Ananas comosus var. bracteatus TaxID=296719 RepID=A0A6V7Q2L5_ANACO|nr:unnamed protein product [Ananas comosus var. bracteatus]